MVFILGYMVNASYKVAASFIARSGNRNNINEVLAEIGKSTYEQSNNFARFLNSLDINTAPVSLQFRIINHLKTFGEISYKEFRSAYSGYLWKRQRDIRRVNEIYKHIYTLQALDHQYKVELKEYISSLREYEDRWNENLGSLRRLYDDVRLRTHGMPLDRNNTEERALYEFLMASDEIWYNFQVAENRLHYANVKNNLLLPLLELARHTDVRGTLILNTYDFSLSALNAFENIEIRYSAFKSSMEGYRDNYRRIARFLGT